MMKDNLSQTAWAVLQKFHMIPKGSHVLVGVSGGADSMALLAYLCTLRDSLGITLTAAHVNHGLRGEDADRDQALVEKYCQSRTVPLVVSKTDIAALCKQTGEGEEECGRRIRYAFFESKAQGGLIATAHTANDNAETLLMNLMRGTGLSGLCGIPPVRGNIIRPLIECTRDQTEAYCKEHHIPFAMDVTNSDDRYRRNGIRHHVIPYFISQNPAFCDSVRRCVTANRRDLAYLTAQGETLLSNSRCEQGYSLAVLKKGEEAPLYYGIKLLLSELCDGMITADHIDGVIALTRKGRGQISLPGKMKLQVSGGILRIIPQREEMTDDFLQEIPIDDGTYHFAGKTIKITHIKNKNVHSLLTYNGLDRDTIGKHLFLRNRRAGDTITLPFRGTKRLKKLFVDEKIPVWERSRCLILCDEQGILWIEGVGVDARCAPTENTKNILTIDITEEQ